MNENISEISRNLLLAFADTKLDASTYTMVTSLDRLACNQNIQPMARRLIYVTEAVYHLTNKKTKFGEVAAQVYLEYSRLYNIRETPISFVDLGGDLYPVNSYSPWFFPIGRGAKDGKSLENIAKMVPSAPPYLYSDLTQAPWRSFTQTLKELQLHGTRLESLNNFPGKIDWISLIRTQLRLAVDCAINGDFSTSRWHSVHASELTIKAIGATKHKIFQAAPLKKIKSRRKGVLKYGRTLKDSHNLVLTANELRRLTGISVPKALLDTIPIPTGLRYTTVALKRAALKSNKQALRLVSFAFPHLRAFVGYDEVYSPSDLKLERMCDVVMFLYEYPGVWDTTPWQAGHQGLFLDSISPQNIKNVINREPLV